MSNDSKSMAMVEAGEAALLRGQFEKAYWALDAALYLSRPLTAAAAGLWQRGLSCYYGGHFKEGEGQFECDMSTNGGDIEEVVWHFLCRCGYRGFETALSGGLLSLTSSSLPEQLSPPPMQQVLELYRGTGSPEAVLALATATDGSVVRSYNDTNALAYAHFYVGLHHEARGEVMEAREHLQAAAECRNPDFMGRLMGTHFKLFCRRFPLKEPPVSLRGHHLSRHIIQGGWQLSCGHLIGDKLEVSDAVRSLLRAVDAGVRVFDCGDIYSGVEELYGRLLRAHCSRGGREADIAIHTKLVPDLEAIRSGSVDRHYVESVIRRSLNRLGTERVGLVQFHWWDNAIPGSLKALCSLSELAGEGGLVERVGITNFDTETTWSFIDAGIKIASTQVSLEM